MPDTTTTTSPVVPAAPIGLDAPGIAPLAASLPPEVRQQAERMVKMGVPVSSIIQCLVDSGHRAPVLPEGKEFTDDRSQAQRAHDDQHGVPLLTDPSAYSVAKPQWAEGEAFVEFQANVGQFLADTGWDPGVGRSFSDAVMQAVRELDAADDPDQLREHWSKTNQAVLSEARREAAGKDVEALFDLAGRDSPIVKELLETGLVAHPSVWLMLVHRAQALAAWRGGRPAK